MRQDSATTEPNATAVDRTEVRVRKVLCIDCGELGVLAKTARSLTLHPTLLVLRCPPCSPSDLVIFLDEIYFTFNSLCPFFFFQDDVHVVKVKDKVHKQAKDRGTHKAQLRLHDSNDQVTEIDPEQSDHQPYSHRGFYLMKSKRHGVALIINNKEFRSEDHKTRRGTDRDEQNLSETWQFLGYHVVVLRNCSRDQMAQTFEKIDDLLKGAKGVANDSFVCCILSHGKEGEVFGSDSRPLEYTRIQRFLAKSETLRSRPKLLFIQVHCKR